MSEISYHVKGLLTQGKHSLNEIKIVHLPDETVVILQYSFNALIDIQDCFAKHQWMNIPSF